MIIKELSKYKYLIKNTLSQMNGINKWRFGFIIEIFGLFVGIHGRFNFLQFGRYGKYAEQCYRNQFEKKFDYLAFNKHLIIENGSGHYTIAFDPSFVKKSGKSTPHVGWFWSGCAGRAQWGLEVGGIAAIDIDNHTAFHLEAVQTPNELKSDSLVDHYTKVILERKETLQSISKYVVADAYFSKFKFVSELCGNGFEVVSRLRDDADLKYLFTGKQTEGKGRPRKYDGKIQYKKLNHSHFTLIEQRTDCCIYQAIVYSKSLKRKINLVLVNTKKKEKWKHKLYFATDLNLAATQLLEYYQTRFQIEFTYRDGKQFTGMNDCQARSENKLHFHINASLTAINLAKISYWLSIPKNQRKAFSMATIKTLHHNELLMKRFFNVFGISADSPKNTDKIRELITFGAIAA